MVLMPLGLTFILVRETEKAVLFLCINVSCKARTKMLSAAFITEAQPVGGFSNVTC